MRGSQKSEGFAGTVIVVIELHHQSYRICFTVTIFFGFFQIFFRESFFSIFSFFTCNRTCTGSATAPNDLIILLAAIVLHISFALTK
jgi:hypothetical protein